MYRVSILLIHSKSLLPKSPGISSKSIQTFCCMPSYIHHIETAVPEFVYRQSELRDRMKEVVEGGEKERRIIHHLYSRSGIDTRYSVVGDFHRDGPKSLFFNGQGANPGTASRNDTYIEKARELFTKVAANLIASSEFRPEDITHLVTISCTGFYAPGPDFDIQQALGLRSDLERYHLGFMGCYASIPGLKLADQICRANPDANVMVVSVELCTIHFQAAPVMDDLLSASVFADGAAGVIVSSRNPSDRSFRLDGFQSEIMPKGKNDMAWSVGDKGFNMILSSYIPDLIGEGLEYFLENLLKSKEVARDQIGFWAVHPGGRAIIDKTEQVLGLAPDDLNHSRNVLSRYGNMSSATILFVLKELLERSDGETGKGIAMAFGPGLTLESALFTVTDP